jgi:hypothetical protein
MRRPRIVEHAAVVLPLVVVVRTSAIVRDRLGRHVRGARSRRGDAGRPDAAGARLASRVLAPTRARCRRPSARRCALSTGWAELERIRFARDSRPARLGDLRRTGSRSRRRWNEGGATVALVIPRTKTVDLGRGPGRHAPDRSRPGDPRCSPSRTCARCCARSRSTKRSQQLALGNPPSLTEVDGQADEAGHGRPKSGPS